MFLPRVYRMPHNLTQPCVESLTRNLTTTIANLANDRLPPRKILNEEDIEEAFLKGSGPGGQKINKTSSAVQLKHVPTGTVIKSQATRSRSQNRKIARRILAEKIEAAEKGSESRTAIKAEIKSRKKASKSKKARRKHRAVEDEQGRDEDAEENMDGDEIKEERV